MNIKDIRIGNLVQDRYGDKYRLISIGSGPLGCTAEKNGIDYYCISVDDLIPIELTEEKILELWFELVGPSRYGKKYRLQMADWGFVIETHFNDKTWFFGHEYYDSGTDSLDYTSLFFCYNLKYVHQFQNLYYSLVGEELV
jgi:hypothetical protein